MTSVPRLKMATYKGLPAPVIGDFWTREESRAHYTAVTSFQIGQIEMVANTGTTIDSPFHRFVDGKDLVEVGVTAVSILSVSQQVRRKRPLSDRSVSQVLVRTVSTIHLLN